MNAVVYTRFSPRRNAEDSESCETQEAICREHAAKKGWEVRSVHEDKEVSGDTWPREGLESALLNLKKGDVLLVYKRCRIARRVLISELVQHQVEGKGATVAAVEGDVAGAGQDPEAVLIRQVLAAVAEFERKQIGARTKAAMKAQQKAGKRVGRYAPYGFAIDPKDTARLVEVPAEQAAISRVKVLVAEGLSAHAIQQTLNEELLGACRGTKWSWQTVKKIVERL